MTWTSAMGSLANHGRGYCGMQMVVTLTNNNANSEAISWWRASWPHQNIVPELQCCKIAQRVSTHAWWRATRLRGTAQCCDSLICVRVPDFEQISTNYSIVFASLCEANFRLWHIRFEHVCLSATRYRGPISLLKEAYEATESQGPRP